MAPAATQARLSALGPSKGISLEEWESRAPLGEDEIRSVATVKVATSQRALPAKFLGTNTAVPTRPSTPLLRRPVPSSAHSLLQSVLSPSSPATAPPSRTHTPLSAPSSTTLSISTPQQFYDWFTTLTSALSSEQDALYRDHLAEVAGYRAACDRLVGACERAEGVCDDMRDAFAFVEQRSESLQAACEHLLEEQNSLLDASDALAHRLSYFSSLEPAVRMLNSPGEALVLSEGFLPMVDRIDDCLRFLKTHREFRDSELYIIRYQQCLTRSMTLVKMHFVTQVRALSLDVSKRMGDRNLSETALQALLYTKASSLAVTLRPLLRELEHRSSSSSASTSRAAPRDPSADDLSSLLAECHAAWLAMRQTLLGQVVAAEVARLDPQRSDLVDLTRAGCGYLKQLCSDEYTLFRQFFSTGDDRIQTFLESLCDHLLDHLRPRILHEPSLTTLSQVCTVLQALMVLDTTDLGHDDGTLSDEDERDFLPTTPLFSPALEAPSPRAPGLARNRSSSSSSYGWKSPYASASAVLPPTAGSQDQRRRTPRQRLQLRSLLSPVLQDAQTRMVFRAQAMLHAQVGKFAPSEADLDYPAKLEKLAALPPSATEAPARNRPARPPSTAAATAIEFDLDLSDDDEDDEDRTLFRLPALAVQQTWYPSLRKALWILEELHSFIDAAIFEDIAHEAVLLCRASLVAASARIAAAAKGGATEVDGKLFLVRHLLILKEMMSSVEMVRRERGRDMLGLTDAFSALLTSALSFLPSALTFGYGATGSNPSLSAPGSDPKADLDRLLKSTCEDLIHLVTLSSTSPLGPFLALAHAQGAEPIAAQAWAAPERVLDVQERTREAVRREVQGWVGKLRCYLGEESAVEVLLPPMQASILEAYRPFADVVRREHGQDSDVARAVGGLGRMADFLRAVLEEERRGRAALPASTGAAAGGAGRGAEKEEGG